MSPAIHVSDLTHTFMNPKEEMIAIESVSFTVAQGEFLVLVGPSGCGKSTLLSLIAGLAPPTYGEIQMHGELIEGPSSKIGYMLQKDGLLPWSNVEDNIMLGLEIRGQATDEQRTRAVQLLNEVGLGHTSHQFPSQLSGGMRQRVALVRTLALDPSILLLDEPFSALDLQNKLHLEELLYRILHKNRITTVLVTHDLEEAIAMGDRILVMGKHPGVIRRILDIPEEIRSLPPMKARGHALFRSLFEELWQEVEMP